VRFVNYLSSSPKLARTRTRAIAVSLTAVGALLFVLGTIPFQNSFRAPGVLEAENYLQVASATSGQLHEVLSENGSWVEPGTPLIQLVNPELEIELALVSAQRKEILALLDQSSVFDADRAREVLVKRLAALDRKLRKTETQRRALQVKSERSGIWIAPHVHELKGVWLARGTKLGKIVSPKRFRFSAVVSQEEAANLFSGNILGKMAVRLVGQASIDLPVTGYKVIPFQHERLPSAALGWGGGGDIPVSGKDDQGLQTLEPFFRIYAELEPSSHAVLNHGHSGQIRFVQQAEPLLNRLLRKVRQFFQKRYQT
jgi:putative peptide zinc metalloprotease protein